MVGNILLVEDSKEVQALVVTILESYYKTKVADTLADARKLLNENEFDLVLLDAMLPDGDGFSFVTELKESPRWSTLPIIFLTGLSDTKDKVKGLALGADDYIVKPFDSMELLARLNSKFRQIQSQISNIENIIKGPLRINPLKQEAYIMSNDTEVPMELTGSEFKIFFYLIRFQDQARSRNQIIDEIRGIDAEVTDRTVDTHIYSIRKKLGPLAPMIQSVPKIGYKFIISD